jgi:hypothetical protein
VKGLRAWPGECWILAEGTKQSERCKVADLVHDAIGFIQMAAVWVCTSPGGPSKNMVPFRPRTNAQGTVFRIGLPA